MNLPVIPKSVLPEWIDRLCGDFRVVGPRRKRDEFVFSDIHSAAEVDLSYSTTILPPKKVFLPQNEELFAFEGNGHIMEARPDNRPVLLLGLHACDMHAIVLLDRVFSQGFSDQHYDARRKKAVLVGLECLQPCSENAFCKDMGTLSVPEGFDLHLTDLGDAYSVDVGSEKGAELISDFEGVREAADKDTRRLDQVMSEKWPRFPYKLEEGITEIPSLMTIGYRNSLWDDLGDKCLGCGSCTNVCPTCFCFDVHDEVDFSLSAGNRFRSWDSCQLNSFAVVAGGHDFRATRAARQRHRFSHKFKYIPDIYGTAGCVGCGRCAKTCVVHITPVETLNQLKKQCAFPAGPEKEAVKS